MHSVYIEVKTCLQTIRMNRWINGLQLHWTRNLSYWKAGRGVRVSREMRRKLRAFD